MKRSISLNQLARYVRDPRSRPVWLAHITYWKDIPKPNIREDDYYAERRLNAWRSACTTLPASLMGCHYLQTFTFGVAGSPDVFVMQVEPGKSPRLYRQETRMVRETVLVPV